MRDQIHDNAFKTATSVWGCLPFLYQVYILPHILRMMSKSIDLIPILMVQSTSTGKSSLSLTITEVFENVTQCYSSYKRN